MDHLLRLLRSTPIRGAGGRPLGHLLAPLTWRVLDFQLRHAAMPALGRVADRLGIRADWVIFGHVHRSGPLPGDDAALWRGPPDGPRLLNTGSWVHEPLLVRGGGPGHPYWPGTGVLLEEDGVPRPVAILGALDAS